MVYAASGKAVARTLSAVAGVVLLGISVSLSAPSAFGQKSKGKGTLQQQPIVQAAPILIERLKAGVACEAPLAGNQLLMNADGAGASLPDLLDALDELSIDASACVEIQDAASLLAQQLYHSNPGFEAERAVTADRMAKVLAEADQRAASVHFEVGPPPRNLTRNREASQ